MSSNLGIRLRAWVSHVERYVEQAVTARLSSCRVRRKSFLQRRSPSHFRPINAVTYVLQETENSSPAKVCTTASAP